MSAKRERDEMASIDRIEKKRKFDDWVRKRSEFNFKLALRDDLIKLIFEFLDFECLYKVMPLVCKYFFVLVKETRSSHGEIRLVMDKIGEKVFFRKCLRVEVDIVKKGIFLKKLKIFHKGAKLNMHDEFNCRVLESGTLRKVLAVNKFESLTVLEMFLARFDQMAFIDFIRNLRNLKELHVSVFNYCRSDIVFFLKKYEKISKTSNISINLSKIKIEFWNLHSPSDHLPQFTGISQNIQNFSMKLKDLTFFSSSSLISAFNPNLSTLKLPQVIFDSISSKSFCTSLSELSSITNLQLNDSIIQAGTNFIDLLHLQSNLKILKLEPTQPDYTLKIQDIINIIDAVNISNITKLKLHSSEAYLYTSLIDPNDKPQSGFIDQDLSKSLIATVSKFLKNSNKLEQLDLEFKYLANKFLLQLAEVIISNLSPYGFHTFAKFNLLNLQNDKQNNFEIKRLDAYKSQSVLFQILMIIIGKNTKLKEIKPRVYLNPLKSLTQTQIFNMNSEKSLKFNTGGSSVEYFVSLCLTPRNYPQLEHLDLSSVCIFPFLFSFSKLILPFTSLKSLKFTITHLPKLFEFTIYDIFTSAAHLKQLENLSSRIQGNITRMNKIFYTFIRHKSISNFVLSHSKILTVQSISQELSLKEVFARSTIKRLVFNECSMTFTKFSQICEILASSSVLEAIELVDISFDLDPWERHLECDENKWKHILKHFFMFIGSLKDKSQYKSVVMRLKELPPSKFPVFPQVVDEYLGLCAELLRNNKIIENFSIIFPISQESLPKYSQFCLAYLKANQNLKILNFYNIKKIMSQTVPVIKTKKFFIQMNANIFSSINKLRIDPTETDEKYGNMGTVTVLMPLILSELVKDKSDFTISTINRSVSKIELLNQTLTIMKISGEFTLFETTEKTLILNCLSSCTTVKKLLIIDIYLYRIDIQVLMSNLPRMLNLESIKVKNIKYKMIDFVIFISPPSLKNFTLFVADIQKIDFTNFAACARRKEFYKFSFRSNVGFANVEKFVEFLKKVAHPTVKVVKFKFALTENLAQVLAAALVQKAFPCIEKLKVAGQVYEGSGIESFVRQRGVIN